MPENDYRSCHWLSGEYLTIPSSCYRYEKRYNNRSKNSTNYDVLTGRRSRTALALHTVPQTASIPNPTPVPTFGYSAHDSWQNPLSITGRSLSDLLHFIFQRVDIPIL